MHRVQALARWRRVAPWRLFLNRNAAIFSPVTGMWHSCIVEACRRGGWAPPPLRHLAQLGPARPGRGAGRLGTRPGLLSGAASGPASRTAAPARRPGPLGKIFGPERNLLLPSCATARVINVSAVNQLWRASLTIWRYQFSVVFANFWENVGLERRVHLKVPS